jgi:hypothetical protein
MTESPVVTDDKPSTTNIYQGTLALLESKGWVQGSNQDEEGRVCLGEAVARTVRNTPDERNTSLAYHSDVRAALNRFVARLRTAGIITMADQSVIAWNDQSDRTYAEVQNALRVASEQCVAEGVTV